MGRYHKERLNGTQSPDSSAYLAGEDSRAVPKTMGVAAPEDGKDLKGKGVEDAALTLIG